jgi:D-alanine-D-alanine ligase
MSARILKCQNRGARSDSTERMPELECLTDRLKARLRIAVVFGGDKNSPDSVLYSAKTTRSWKSYESVARDIAGALREIGFAHVHVMPDDMNLPDRLRRDRIHIAWLNTGGVQGYNPAAHTPAMLEMLGLPYIGHDPLAATTLDNKHAFKREAVSAGLPTAAFSTWDMTRGRFNPSINSRFQKAFGAYGGPFIVKPVSGRASLHVHVVPSRDELADVIADVYAHSSNTVLIEKYLSGREYCIAVAGPVVSRQGKIFREPAPFTFAALERVLTKDEKIFTSMDVAPITGDRCRPVDAAENPELARELHEIGRETFLEFSLRSLVRLDVRADEAGKLHILEANPKPDLKRPSGSVTSLICEGLRDEQMDYHDLIFTLLADRLDFLAAHRRETVSHILDLAQPSASAGRSAKSNASGDLERVADDNVRVLNALVLQANPPPAPPQPLAVGSRFSKP